MTLGEFYRTLYRPIRLAGCAKGTDTEYQGVLSHWNRLVGLDIDGPGGISAQVLARLAAEIAGRTSPATANKVLRHILALLRYAKELDVLKGDVPKRPKLKEPKRLPEAWTVDEVQVILAEAIREPGDIDGVPANRWWYSILLTIYYCGGRITAVRKTIPEDFLFDQRAIILRAANQKQNADQYLHLPDQVVAAVAALHCDGRALVWPWPYHESTLFSRFRAILQRAGVRYGQGRGGLFGKMRRTHASYLALGGADASYSLGHSSPRVTRDHYLDPRIVSRGQVDRLPKLNVNLPGSGNGDRQDGNPAWRV
jgi:integrase